MFEKLSDNLNLLMAEARISASELARRTGLPASTIKQIRNRGAPNPTLTTLSILAKYFSLSLSQFVGEEEWPKFRLPGEYHMESDRLNKVPIISWEELSTKNKVEINTPSFVNTENDYDSECFAITIETDALDNIRKGTIVIINPHISPQNRDIIVLKKNDSPPHISRFLTVNNKKYIRNLDQEEEITELTDEYIIFGVIVEYRKTSNIIS